MPRSTATMNNLKQMGLGMHYHHLGATHRAIAALVARGVSFEGARQFLNGEAVMAPGDRHRLPAIMSEPLGTLEAGWKPGRAALQDSTAGTLTPAARTSTWRTAR